MQTSIDISGNLYTELGSPVVKKGKNGVRDVHLVPRCIHFE